MTVSILAYREPLAAEGWKKGTNIVASAATLGPAANEMFSRKGAVQEVATHDRLYNRYITASESLCCRL